MKSEEKLDKKTKRNLKKELKRVIWKIPNKVKEVRKELGDDIALNKGTYKLWALEQNVKIMNKIYRTNKSLEEWLGEINAEKRAKGKKEYKL